MNAPISGNHSTRLPPDAALHEFRGLFVSLVCVLVGFGVVMVHSASVTSWPTEFEQVYLSKHLIFLTVGVLAGGLCALAPPDWWRRASPALLLVTVVLLAAVLVPGIGTRVNGARRWLRYGGLSLQPSELAKIALPLVACRIVILRPRRDHWLRDQCRTLFPVAVVVALVLPEPDLGTSVFLILSYGIALFVAGWPLRGFLISAVLTFPAGMALVALRPYQMQRITGFLSAWSNIDGAPWQLKQSLLALGAGGPLGVGPGQGSQKLSYLPEANTDFVFAVVGEEYGFLGTLTLILIWVGLFLTGMRLLSGRTGFARAAGSALLAQLALQAAINVAVVTAVVPPKGIAHPLISYGGSNLVTSLMAVGIIISLSRSPSAAATANLSGRPSAAGSEQKPWDTAGQTAMIDTETKSHISDNTAPDEPAAHVRPDREES